MADKKEKPASNNLQPGRFLKETDVKSMARKLIMSHPEVLYNARDLFRNENGTTIPEAVVPREDPKPVEAFSPATQYDLTNDDLKSISAYASTLIDKRMSKYDERIAYEDALAKAIWSKDEGKYQNRVNANTYELLLATMGKIKKASEEDKPEKEEPKEEAPKEDKPKKVVVPLGKGEARMLTPDEKEELEKKVKKEPSEDTKPKEDDTKKEKVNIPQELIDRYKKLNPEEKPKEEPKKEESKPKDKNAVKEDEKMDKQAALKEIEVTEKKLASLKEIQAVEEKLASLKASVTDEKPKVEAKVEDKKEAAVEVPESIKGITASLDKIAGDLEKSGNLELFKIAYNLDTLSEVLEGTKDAKVLEDDPSEEITKKLKDYFQGNKVREGDPDPSKPEVKKEFEVDKTEEVKKIYEKPEPVKKEASVRPFAILK